MLNLIYNQTVTILNKLKRTDGQTGLDVWYKTTLNNVAWYVKSERTVNGTSVYIGTYKNVLIPFNEDFLPYSEWKELGNQDGHFTMSENDYIILGVVDEEVTTKNITSIIQKYGENVCLVKYHRINYDRFGATVQLSIEGV